MKGKFSLLILALALAGSITSAQHSVALSSQPSTTPGVSAYNVYRAPCTTVAGTLCTVGEGTFAKIGTATIGTTITYTDSSVLGGKNYSYYFTAACPTAGCGIDSLGNLISGESGPSNKVGAAIPATQPLPPGNLAITTIARNLSPTGVTTVVAGWATTPNTQSTYTFYGNGSVLAKGVLKNTSGTYTATWSGVVKPGASISFEICTANGACSSKLI
jgi:hypothetical protein